MKYFIKWQWLMAIALLCAISTANVLAATAPVNVRVQPSGNTFASAYVLSTEQRTLFGNVEGGAGTYECQWSFSDGTPTTAWTAVTNPRYVTVDHTYATSAAHWARLSCRDSVNPLDTDSATIEMFVTSAESLNRQKNSAIDQGLRYAYQGRINTGTYTGCFTGDGIYTASTGMALLAFENHGHNLDSSDEDIYKPMVEGGLQCLFDRYAQSVTMAPQACVPSPEAGIPVSTNGIGIRFQTTNQYYTPFALMAIVNSGTKATGQSTIVSSSNLVVNGMSLYDIVVDIRDYLAWSMTDGNCSTAPGSRGNGWRYGENYSSVDNSFVQWPNLALSEAEERWQIEITPDVKIQVATWLAYSQTNNGAFGYDFPGSWDNMAKGAAGIIGLHYLGGTLADPAVQNALDYMGTQYHFTSTGGGCFGGCHWDRPYHMYAFYKAMKLYGITSFVDSSGVAHDWETEYQRFLADPAEGNLIWDAGRKAARFDLVRYWYSSNDSNNYTGLAMLAPEVSSLPPQADAGNDQIVLPNQVVSFDGSNSFHQDPTKAIVSYDWDFDASDGLWWNTVAVPGAGEGDSGLMVTNSYPETGSAADYTVTLRVSDNGQTPANPDAVMTDLDTMNVHVDTQQVAPIAVTNGPWAAVPGQIVTFDGSASYDPNPGDSIVSYEWDLDGDTVFNNPDGSDGTPVTPGDWSIVQKTFIIPVSNLATLRVTDTFGAQGSSTDNFIAIGLAYVENYQTCWRVRQNRFSNRFGISVTVENIGNADIDNLILTLTSVPSNRHIVSDLSDLGNLTSGAQVATACDYAAKTADIITDVNRRISPTGDWSWQAEFDSGGEHYVIPNLPPLLP